MPGGGGVGVPLGGSVAPSVTAACGGNVTASGVRGGKVASSGARGGAASAAASSGAETARIRS